MARRYTRKSKVAKEPLPERICPFCGKKFVPKSKLAIYHSNRCRVAATRQRQRQAAMLDVLNGDLERLRKGLPETARLVEDATMKHGVDVGRMVLNISLAAAKEFKELYDTRMREPNGRGE